MRKDRFFFLGLVVLYLVLFFSKSWQIYFLGFLVCGIFFYLQFKNLVQTIFLISITAIPYSVGPGRSQAISEASGFTSSYGLIPFTISTIFLSLYLFWKKSKLTLKYADLAILAFYLYGILGFIVQNSYFTSLYGLAQLTVMIIFYFVARVMVTEFKINHYIILILLTIVGYESILALAQFILQSPLGIFPEEFVRSNPFGIISAENLTLFRSSGTLSHPNNLSVLLVMLLPVAFYSRKITLFSRTPILFINLILLVLGALFVTFSRVGIFLGVSLSLLYLLLNFKVIITKYRSYVIYTCIFLSFLLIVLYPSIAFRLSTLPEVLDPGNTLDARVKSVYEAVAQVSKSPIFGVGINRFIEIAVENPTTNLFELVTPDKLIDIHNLIIQIATGLGIPALLIFSFYVLTLFFEFKKKLGRKNNSIVIITGVGILLFLLESMMTPLLVRPLMRLFFLYSAILVSE